MAERHICLTHLDGRREMATIQNFTPLRLGTRGGKLFLDLKREGSTEILHMMQRRVEYSEIFRGNKTSSEHYMHLWNSLKDAGVTVVNEVVALSHNKVAETDVTAEGSLLLGKNSSSEEMRKGVGDTIDLEEVRKEALRQAELASKKIFCYLETIVLTCLYIQTGAGR